MAKNKIKSTTDEQVLMKDYDEIKIKAILLEHAIKVELSHREMSSTKNQQQFENALAAIRKENYSKRILERKFAELKIEYDRLCFKFEKFELLDDHINRIKAEKNDFLEKGFLDGLTERIALKEKPSKTATKGGEAKAAPFKILEAETIKLYEQGSWKSAPLAAAEITPKIIEFSRVNGGYLLPSTTKPLEWIRKHIRTKKSKSS